MKVPDAGTVTVAQAGFQAQWPRQFESVTVTTRRGSRGRGGRRRGAGRPAGRRQLRVKLAT